MFLSIGMLKQKYFLADIFILSAEKQPIKLSWRKIECLLMFFLKYQHLSSNSSRCFFKIRTNFIELSACQEGYQAKSS